MLVKNTAIITLGSVVLLIAGGKFLLPASTQQIAPSITPTVEASLTPTETTVPTPTSIPFTIAPTQAKVFPTNTPVPVVKSNSANQVVSQSISTPPPVQPGIPNPTGFGENSADFNLPMKDTIHAVCGKKTTCSEMTACEEAHYYYDNCGVKSLDETGDGTICHNVCK